MHRTKKQADQYEDLQKVNCPTCEASVLDQEHACNDLQQVIQDQSSIRLQDESQSQFDYLNESSPRLPRCPHINDDSLDSDQHPFNPRISSSEAPLRHSPTTDPPNTLNCNLEPHTCHMSTLQHKSIGFQIIPIGLESNCQNLQRSEEVQQSGRGSDVTLQIDLDNIFEQRPIQRTRNITKAIRKYIQRHLSKYQDHFDGHKDFFKKMRKQIKESKDEYFSLESMTRIFKGNDVPEGMRNLPRLVIRKILNRWLRKSIIPNNQVKDKLTYLVATKVYSLRCSNEQLSSRVQMR